MSVVHQTHAGKPWCGTAGNVMSYERKLVTCKRCLRIWEKHEERCRANMKDCPDSATPKDGER